MKAIDAPENAVGDIELIATLLKQISSDTFDIPSIDVLRGVIAKRIDILSGCQNVGASGAVLDGSRFAAVDFPETDAMLFKKNQHAKTGDANA